MSNLPPPIQEVLATHPSDLKSPTPSPQISPASISKPKWKSGGSNYLDSLHALPQLRPIPWVPGKELPPEKSTESSRIQTRSAFLLSTRGKINDPPCAHCATGLGRFLYCVSLDSWFHGSCSTCLMATRGNLCSLRVQAKEQGDGQGANPSAINEPHTGKAPSAKKAQQNFPIQTPKVKRKRQSLHNEQLISYTPSPAHTADGVVLRETHSHYMPQSQATQNLTNNVREGYKGHTLSNQTYTAPHTAPNASTPPANTQPSYHQYQTYATQNTNSEISYYNYNDPSANVINHIYKAPPQAESISNPQSSFPPVNQAQPRPVPPQATSQLRFLVPQTPANRGSGPLKPVSAPVNESIVVPSPSADREESRSISPSEQLLGSAQPVLKKSRQEMVPPASSLNKLSETRQKQVEDLVRSLRNGVKNAKEQAEIMQRQLDQLEDVLGFSETSLN